MVSIMVATRSGVLIARRASTWTVEQHLGDEKAREHDWMAAPLGSWLSERSREEEDSCRILHKLRGRARLSHLF